jgi:hypothetical protein
MFGALGAAQYLTRLLKFDDDDMRQFQLIFPNEPGAFFIIAPTVQNARPIYIANRPAWLIDYILRNYGTVVPQRIWAPANAADAQRYGHVRLNMPIFFVRDDRRTLGLRLVEAAEGNCAGLLDGRAPAPVGDIHTASIRLNVSVSSVSRGYCANNIHFQWPGYGEQNSQIMTRDQRPGRNLIPLEALAARVARVVCRFLAVRLSESSWHLSSD